MTVFDDIRSSCAAVAEAATHVTIDTDRLAAFASEIDLAVEKNDPGQDRMGSEESATAFVIALDAINFGSGYFSYLHKRPGIFGMTLLKAATILQAFSWCTQFIGHGIFESKNKYHHYMF